MEKKKLIKVIEEVLKNYRSPTLGLTLQQSIEFDKAMKKWIYSK